MSPIEKKLRDALLSLIPDDMCILDDTTGDVHGGDDASCVAILGDQANVGSYRVDFLLTIDGSGPRLAVECDGHDWHERTKQQAAYDRSRDRDLLKLGIRTARFTGSEIHHSPERCAADVFDILRAMHEEHGELQVSWMAGAESERKRARAVA